MDWYKYTDGLARIYLHAGTSISSDWYKYAEGML